MSSLCCERKLRIIRILPNFCRTLFQTRTIWHKSPCCQSVHYNLQNQYTALQSSAVCSQHLTSQSNVTLKHYHTTINRAFFRTTARSGDVDSKTTTEGEESNEQDLAEPDSHELYLGHIPTTTFQKCLLSVASALVTITSPHRGDMLAAFGEASGHTALRWMKSRMDADPVGRQILQERPRINSRTVNLQHLSELGDETFGRAYANWLRDNRASPDDRLPVQFVDDAELWYVMQRYREIHDLLHCLLGMPTNMLGEVTVKVFEGIQTRLPMCVTGGVFGPLRLGPKHSRLYFRTHLGWAIRNAINASDVMNVYFEHHWNEPITELRQRLNIEEPPYTPIKSSASMKETKHSTYDD